MPHVASAPERYFRESLEALVLDTSISLPPMLRDALAEHLYRRDGAGHSLCFANPERERLLDELTPVLLAHVGARDKRQEEQYGSR